MIKEILTEEVAFELQDRSGKEVDKQKGQVGGKLKREKTYVYLWLIHVDIWQKAAQYYKTNILQLKNF